MNEEWLAGQFEANRDHLRSVAYRMLGSASDAEDAVQESWLRLSRADTSEVENLGGWLTTVTARVCLDMLRSRKSRREDSLEDFGSHEAPRQEAAVAGPEQEALLADSVGPALLVVLETLAPAERLAFVLHDLFAVPFDEIAPIVGRTPAATRQLASRARRRVQGADRPESDLGRQRQVVDAFLAASRDGNFDALLSVLAPDVELRADETTVAASVANHAKGAPLLSARMTGAREVATAFAGRARGALPALIDGNVGAVWMYRGEIMGLFVFEVEDDRIVGLELVNDQDRVRAAEVEVLPSR
ncbi:sigma-70 family RNA polymerase sigma factor [Kutzneria kofuensis]|uniref:RNA polymerase sigma-70 factor (ECF subfamily) n=1 Tax=Kutzneria kofuensis TaxID=103725 RepID=A0A7W9NM51_9PSEU|nr:sigma-70 family RNA polymerase sigma factor [Kutzneria kofuensis]MBB5897770.1 RNA polymerase sigma-70 factor (ECF subfamily) [Kutzneria kofuensis]